MGRNIPKYTEFFGITKTTKLHEIDKFFDNILDKTIILFGKNNNQKKILISYLVRYYNKISCEKFLVEKFNVFNGIETLRNVLMIVFIEFAFVKKNGQYLMFLEKLDNKLFSYSKMKNRTEKKIVLLYNINILDKIGQKKLQIITERYKMFFYFIFTTEKINNIYLDIKKKSICFPISAWSILVKKYFSKVKIKKEQLYEFKTLSKSKRPPSFISKGLKISNKGPYDTFSFGCVFLYKLIIFWYKNCLNLNLWQNNKFDMMIKNCLGPKILKMTANLYSRGSFSSKRFFDNDWGKKENLITKGFLICMENFFRLNCILP
nr:hypothetical protein 1634Bnrm3_p061 [Cryptomonas sp.]